MKRAARNHFLAFLHQNRLQPISRLPRELGVRDVRIDRKLLNGVTDRYGYYVVTLKLKHFIGSRSEPVPDRFYDGLVTLYHAMVLLILNRK